MSSTQTTVCMEYENNPEEKRSCWKFQEVKSAFSSSHISHRHPYFTWKSILVRAYT